MKGLEDFRASSRICCPSTRPSPSSPRATGAGGQPRPAVPAESSSRGARLHLELEALAAGEADYLIVPKHESFWLRMHPDLQRHWRPTSGAWWSRSGCARSTRSGRAARDAPEGALRLAQPPDRPARRGGGVRARAVRGDARRTATSSRCSSPASARRCSTAERAPRGHAASAAVNDDPNQYFLYTETVALRLLHMTSRDKSLYTRTYRDFLLAHQPDVVHFQHTLFIGYDMLARGPRRVLPDAPIVYTLHEYLPICHRDGQMVRTDSDELCREASPRRCHECFPDDRAAGRSSCASASSSRTCRTSTCSSPRASFLLERYVDWGIPREKIRVRGVRPPAARAPPPERDGERPRNRLGFFGQLNHYKGVNVLLEAMKLLAERGRRRAPAGCTARTSSSSRRTSRTSSRSCSRPSARQRHLRRPLRPRRAAGADGRRRLGGRARRSGGRTRRS